MSADRGQRRAELVRHGHEERALELLRFCELVDHAAEALAQERDLVSPSSLRDLDVVPAGGDVLRRARQHADRLGQPARQPEEQEPRERDADREREREPPEQRQPLLAKLRLGLGDDQPAERLGALDELHRLRGGDEPPTLARRSELDDDLLVAVELGAAERASRQASQPEALRRKRREADVVELVTCRELELLGRELGRLRPLVGRAQRRLGVQGGETGRLAPQLVHRLLARHVLKEPHGERDRGETEDEDDGEEHRREAEPKRSQHGIQGRASEVDAAARSDATL